MEPLIITQVKELLAKGDLEDAVKLLSTYAESNLSASKANKVKNEIIHIQGQLSEVKKAEFKGLIAFEQAERNRNQIRVSMLSLTDAVTGNDETHPVFTAASAPSNVNQNTGTNNIYKYIVVGIGAIVLFVLGINMCDDGSQNTNPASIETGADAASGEMHPDDQICFITTLESVPLLFDADFDSEIAVSVPADVQLEVFEKKTHTTPEGATEYYQVSYNNVVGWVEYDELALSFGADCN